MNECNNGLPLIVYILLCTIKTGQNAKQLRELLEKRELRRANCF